MPQFFRPHSYKMTIPTNEGDIQCEMDMDLIAKLRDECDEILQQQEDEENEPIRGRQGNKAQQGQGGNGGNRSFDADADRPAGYRLTPEQAEQVDELLMEGQLIDAEIARKVGCTNSTVSYHRRKLEEKGELQSAGNDKVQGGRVRRITTIKGRSND
jgi:DNA-binding CsgD family transcriptional regulator